jgi:CDP-diglyceride synthetase
MLIAPPVSYLAFPALLSINLGVIVPLSLSCLVVVVVIPAAAWRGRLNVPVYALMMFASAFIAYVTGKLAGAQSVQGTVLGVVISFIFFLLVATAVGSFFGIFFYRQPLDDAAQSPVDHEASPAIAAIDKDQH